MKSTYYDGLKKRPTFNEIIGYIETDQQKMKYPDRTITRLINHPYYLNLDGNGPMSYQDQIKNIQIEQLKAMQYGKMKKTNI